MYIHVQVGDICIGCRRCVVCFTTVGVLRVRLKHAQPCERCVRLVPDLQWELTKYPHSLAINWRRFDVHVNII